MVLRAQENWPDEKEIKSENGIHYFTRPKGNHSYRFCCEFATVIAVNGKKEVHRCAYSSPDKKTFLTHACNFVTPIPPGYRIPKSYQPRVKSFGIIQAAALVSAKLNISIKAMTSQEMLNLLNIAYQEGVKFALKNKLTSPDEVPRYVLSKEALRKYIIKSAEKYQNEADSLIQQCTYFSCSFDAWTVNSRQAIFWCLASPGESKKHYFIDSEAMLHSWNHNKRSLQLQQTKPYTSNHFCWNLFHSIVIFFQGNLYIFIKLDSLNNNCVLNVYNSEAMLHLWNHKDYYEWAERISLKYAKLVAFVGDGLPAAVKGIADFSAVGLCNETFGAVLIFSPCYNHILNNSFIDSINNSAEILKVVNDARKLVVLINKQKVKEQKIKVPSIPETRWLYTYDVV